MERILKKKPSIQQKPELVAAQSGPTVNSPIVQLCSSRRQPPVSEPPGLPGPVSEPTLSREQSCVLPQQPGLTEPCQLTFHSQGQIASSSNSADPCPSLTFGDGSSQPTVSSFKEKCKNHSFSFWRREPQLCQASSLTLNASELLTVSVCISGFYGALSWTQHLPSYPEHTPSCQATVHISGVLLELLMALEHPRVPWG